MSIARIDLTWAGWARTMCAVICIPLIVLAGCSESPPRTEPGAYRVTIEWGSGASPIGAAVVFLAGSGLGEVTTRDEGLAWRHTPAGEEGSVRVLVVHTGTPQRLEFEIEVTDLSGAAPQGTLLNLASQENLPVEVSGAYQVRVVPVH